jgi:hypothetical protein
VQTTPESPAPSYERATGRAHDGHRGHDSGRLCLCLGAELGSQRPGGRLPSGISCLLRPSTCYLDVHLHLYSLTRYFLSHVIYMPTYLGTYLCHVPFETKTQSPTPNSARRDAGEATLDRHTMMAKGTRCLFFSCVLCSVSCAYLSMSSARPYRYRASPPAIAPMYLYLPSAIRHPRQSSLIASGSLFRRPVSAYHSSINRQPHPDPSNPPKHPNGSPNDPSNDPSDPSDPSDVPSSPPR